MCLSIPAEVITVKDETALVSVNGMQVNVSIMLLDHLKTGDYVLIHSGFAIEIIDSEEAEKTLALIRHMRISK